MTTNSRFLAVIISVSVILAGCAVKRVNIDPSNPVYELKNEFELDYGRIITPDERQKGYTLEDYPNLSEPIKPFDEIDLLGEFRRFEKHFWDIRDTDPNTVENEYKELIDSRIQDIKDEIFALDPDIPGTRFDVNGGLKGDLARVYMLHGMPHQKAKLSENLYHVELITWYYFDYQGRPLMRFLFYEKYGRLYVLKNQVSFGLGIDMALEEISARVFMSPEKYEELWHALIREDPERIFLSALLEFSYYIKFDDRPWNVDVALEPPEPAALTAERFKPTILGQSNIPEETELFESDYHSFLPAYIRTEVDSTNPTSLMVTILRKNVDWVKQDNETKPYVANLNLRISFQNKKTLKLTEFMTYLKQELSQEAFDHRDEAGELMGSIVIFSVIYPHFDDEKLTLTLGEMLKQLESGKYVVNIYLQHTLTKKYNAWREEIVISH